MRLCYFNTQFIFLLLLLIFVSGCSKTLRVEALGGSVVTHKQDKNYKIGQTKMVNVGESIIKFQDYYVESVYDPIMSPEANVVISGGIVTFALAKNGKYPVRGQITLDGTIYTVVANSSNPHNALCVLVRSDGRLHNKVVSPHPYDQNELIPMIYTFNISNPNVKMIRSNVVTPVQGKPFQDYELIYTGINENSLNLTYREYSPDGLARTAFYQNLTYQVDSKQITFKNYKIYVQSASSDSIVFKVISD